MPLVSLATIVLPLLLLAGVAAVVYEAARRGARRGRVEAAPHQGSSRPGGPGQGEPGDLDRRPEAR